MALTPPISLDRLVPAPIKDENFSAAFNSWLSVTIDTLNEVIAAIETQLNA